MLTRGRLATFFAGAAIALGAGGVAAFACTNLATAAVSSSTGRAGETLTFTGSSFAAPEEGAPPSPVVVHWGSAGGPVLAELAPDARGSVSGSFSVPQAGPGHFVIVATQVDAEGEPQFGTPARVPFEVVGANGESVPPPVTDGAPLSSGSGSGGTSMLLVLGIVAACLLAGGLAAYRQSPPRPSPVPEARPARR
ncbi:MAG TPA: hypothetical protein VM242_00100 [Acidimicrobiales bacterium]|nr:hypothetical protein [Acidimicrobiales bacterium]